MKGIPLDYSFTPFVTHILLRHYKRHTPLQGVPLSQPFPPPPPPPLTHTWLGKREMLGSVQSKTMANLRM